MNGIVIESSVVKEYDFNKPDFYEIDYSLDDNIKDCRIKYFHTVEYKLVYDIKFTNIYKYKKIKITRKKGFIFNQINKLTIKNYSNLSNINIRYSLILPIRKLHRRFF